MVVTIHQPEHLPWLGFFHKAAQADVLVLLDNVQYRHKYFQNRNRIRSYSGACWLNVPILLKGQGRPLLKDLRINPAEVRWQEKCWRTMTLNYRKAKHFKTHAPFFEEVYARSWNSLVEFNAELLGYLFRALGVTTRMMWASELAVAGMGPELILEIVQQVGGDCYVSGVSGIAGKGRGSEEAFAQRGIAVRYQEFHHPIYAQLYEPFLPCMSVIDLLFNYGPSSLDVINGVGVNTMAQVFE